MTGALHSCSTAELTRRRLCCADLGRVVCLAERNRRFWTSCALAVAQQNAVTAHKIPDAGMAHRLGTVRRHDRAHSGVVNRSQVGPEGRATAPWRSQCHVLTQLSVQSDSPPIAGRCHRRLCVSALGGYQLSLLLFLPRLSRMGTSARRLGSKRRSVHIHRAGRDDVHQTPDQFADRPLLRLDKAVRTSKHAICTGVM